VDHGTETAILIKCKLTRGMAHVVYSGGSETDLLFLNKAVKGHVTRNNLSCNLQRKRKFTCSTPFCNCNCCVASCKKSRTTVYISQRCETSCLRVTSPQQLATQFCQKGPIRASAILFVIVRVASCEKNCKRVTPPLQLERFFIRHRCVASCKKNCLV